MKTFKTLILPPPTDKLSLGGGLKNILTNRASALALFMMTGALGAQAQTYLTFDENVRYSQLVIDSRLHDFYGNTKLFGFDYYDASGNQTSTVQWKNGNNNIDRSFDYVAGLVGKATIEAATYYATDWAKPWYYAAQGYATGTSYTNPSDNSKLSLDNLNGVKMYTAILDCSWASDNAKSAAETAIAAAITSLGAYNTNYVIGNATNSGVSSTTNEAVKGMFGGWFHKPSYTDQMWCDGLYMGSALLADIVKYKKSTTNVDSQNDWDLIAKQFTISWAQLYDSSKGLLYHAFTANPGDDASKSWEGISKSGTTYHSAAYWSRANAWYFLALVDVLEKMPTDNTNYNTLKGYLSNLADGLKKYQDQTTGGWYQVLDQKDEALDGNYIEGSGTCIITAAYLKAIRLGLIDKNTYETVAKNAYKACVEQFMIYDSSDNTKVHLINSCASAGLGGKNNRNGSRSYYITGSDVTKITSYTEGKILGGFILAATEYERAYLDKEKHSVLFTRPVQNNNNTLSADASTSFSNATVSYQWYKQPSVSKVAARKIASDDTKIEGATTSTYTPTSSGSYYVVASDGTNSVESGIMTITLDDENGTDEPAAETTNSVTLAANGISKESTWKSGDYRVTFGGEDKSFSTEKDYVKIPKGKTVTMTFTGSNITKIVITYGTKKDTYSNTTTITPPSTSDNNAFSVSQSTDGSVVVTVSDSSNDIYVTMCEVTYGGSSESTKYTITATTNDAAMGSVVITSNGSSITSGASVAKGTALTITATASEGYEFSSWSVSGTTGTESGNTYTISSLDANTTVQAIFAEKTTEVENKTYTFAVKNETYTRNQTIWVDEDTKCARVVLGGWMFPKTVKHSGTSTDEFGASNADWGSTTNITSGDEYVQGFEYQVGEGTNKNPRQEDGSNSQPASTTIYNAKMQSQGTIRDPMFQVPCNGAYLVFTAEVPGTITSIIFQNGVFDKSGNDISYRPQRRVFVMDEAGRIVPTRAELKNSDGKPESTTWSEYSWDLKSDSETLGDELAKTHFVSLTDFTLSSFKNGVYESNLSYDKCKNEVLQDNELKDKTGEGYRGWCVLADAPVAYTFDVKPGKTYYLYNFGSRIGFYGYTFTPKSDVTTDNITLNENVTSQDIKATEDGHMATVSLDRTFKGGIWNAAVLPFSMNKQQIDDIFGTTYSKGNESGTQILYYDRVQNDTVYFVRHAYNSIVAGKPFLIKPSKTGDITLNTANITSCPYKYVTIENTTPAEWCADGDFAWVSSYANQTISNGDHYIGASTGNLIHRTASDITAKGFRGFLKAKSSNAKAMTLFVANGNNTFSDETTGIVRLEMDSDGNFVERPANGKVYNMSGQVVATDASQFNSLPRGIYIVNGKKYVK